MWLYWLCTIALILMKESGWPEWTAVQHCWQIWNSERVIMLCFNFHWIKLPCSSYNSIRLTLDPDVQHTKKKCRNGCWMYLWPTRLPVILLCQHGHIMACAKEKGLFYLPLLTTLSIPNCVHTEQTGNNHFACQITATGLVWAPTKPAEWHMT